MLNSNDTMLATCGSDRMINVWDLRKAKEPVMINTESQSCIMACDWSADDQSIISATIEGVINGLDIKTNKMAMKHDTMALTPDLPSNMIYHLKSVKNYPSKGNHFTLGAENRMAHIIDFDPTAKYEAWMLEIKQKYEGHSAGIRDITFNSDCSRLLTGCEDHSLRLWDPKTNEPICLFKGHTDFVVSSTALPC